MTAGHGEKITRTQEAAIAALLLHPTLDKAAQTAKVNASTLRRWLKNENFRIAYTAARREAVDRAVGKLQNATEKAVTTLESVMRNGETAASRVTAARTILEFAFRAVEIEGVEARLKALEAKL